MIWYWRMWKRWHKMRVAVGQHVLQRSPAWTVLKFLIQEHLVDIKEMKCTQLVMYAVMTAIRIAKVKFNKRVSEMH